ncbi:hypothetical protein Ahy_B08g092738 [Arachis hypogaea]|uniref:Protein FAR1-RELATED SEQUENCE n=1 Tax=Arachis hypogaea TaxID=3818 RepID=A0A444Y4L6_ARAHY|nr:hypothetical protein Ahy_B08g092738 [Arachis hypogaea]
MDDSTSDCHLNQGEVDFEFESNEVPEIRSGVDQNYLGPFCDVDDQFIPKVGMTFNTLEDATKFYNDYAKATNPTAGLNCPARIYIHTLKDVGAWIISKVVLHHSHPCCPTQAEVLKQHRELSMSIRRTIENNEEAGIRPSKTYQSFVAATGDLYEDRHIWVPIYQDHHFWAEMRSTQRSESMHSFFNKFNIRNSSLIQFVKQYDNCLGSREQRERESDAADFYTVIPCATKSSIEAQFQHVYTHQKFREVQAQFRGKATCITRLTNSTLGYSVYEVGEQVSSSIFNKFAVTYDSVAAQVKCQCLLFESRGILCRHALSVLSIERATQQEGKEVTHTHIKSSHDKPLLEPRSKRFDELVFHSQNIYKFTSESEELIAILHRAYDNVMVEMEELKAKRKGTCSLSHEDAKLESVNELQSPQGLDQEDIVNASKKKKSKALNELNLFDSTSVVQPNSSQYHGHAMNYQFKEPTAGDSFLGV